MLRTLKFPRFAHDADQRAKGTRKREERRAEERRGEERRAEQSDQECRLPLATRLCA